MLPGAGGAFPITPSDNANLSAVATGGIYVGSTGFVQVSLLSGQTVGFQAPSGTVIPVQATKVWYTNTTASQLVGLVA